MKQTPLVLITGFLGSGKTTLLKRILERHAEGRHIAVIQNEFADSGVDGKELKQTPWRFELVEINTGSVFCICLFASFREDLACLIEEHAPDMVILEATGLADPIAVSQLLSNNTTIYLSQIVTVIDAMNYMKSSRMVRCIDNQTRVADTVLINKCDMVQQSEIEQIRSDVYAKNPFANIVETSHCQLPEQFDIDSAHTSYVTSGELTSRDNSIISQVYRSTDRVTMEQLERFLGSLPSSLIRMKGYVVLTDGTAVMVQRIYKQTKIVACAHGCFSSEITSLGYQNIDYELLKR